MLIFVGILLVGLAYVWAKGDLEWDKPAQVPSPDLYSLHNDKSAVEFTEGVAS